MQKLPAVEQAKTFFDEAKDWSVWHWLLEKRKARTIADAANACLDELDRQVKASWSAQLALAYRELELEARSDGDPRAKRRYEKARQDAGNVSAEVKLAARRVKEADDAAAEAREDAERTFAEAERLLSAALSREGAHKALKSWELREKAIRRSEAAGRRA